MALQTPAEEYYNFMPGNASAMATLLGCLHIPAYDLSQ